MSATTFNLNALEATNRCEFLGQMRDYEVRMVKRFDLLIFLVAVVVAASLIGLIVAISISEWGATAATAVGTVVSGTAMGFILKERMDHRAQIRYWLQKMSDSGCS